MLRDYRRLLAIGTGVGIEIRHSELRVTAVRVRPSGVTFLGSTVVKGFRERPALEWGTEYSAFLGRVGAGHIAASVMLPRADVIVRQLALPGVANRDLASAVELQIDSLYPFEEDEAVHAWARLPGTAFVLVAIVRRTPIERNATLFQEAGIKIASFTFSAAALYSGVRLFGVPPEGGFLAVVGDDGEQEIFGGSPSRPLLSAVLDGLPERAVPLATAELRLPPDTEPVAAESVLPAPRGAPADFDLSRDALPYAAALAGACPRLALAANLLPAGYRSADSRALYLPTAALATVLTLLLIGLVAQSRYQNRRYLVKLEAEIARFEPLARQVEQAERAFDDRRARIGLLDGFRLRTHANLDALIELTRLVKPPGYLNTLELTRDAIVLNGETDQAAQLLGVLDGSPLFRDSEFSIPITRAGKAEVFRLRAAREGVR